MGILVSHPPELEGMTAGILEEIEPGWWTGAGA
jgi:hypothetical protein